MIQEQFDQNTPDPVAAFEQRQDARDARRLTHLQAEGYTHSRCNRCHKVRVLSWAGGECNEYDASGDDELCGGLYRPAGVHA